MKRPKIVTEIGINHNGDIKIAKSLISLSKNLGADYVKFQKKTPNICVPEHQKNIIKTTVFGPMRYIDYKNKIEFGKKEYDEIDEYCNKLDMNWFPSVWDEESLDFINNYNVPYIKIPSACLTDLNLLRKLKELNKPIILSTGMSTKNQIDEAINILGDNLKYILHTTSSYPTPNTEMNMNKINTLKKLYGNKYKIGFSNHCEDLIYTIQSYIMGSEMIEFHITLDRNMNGTDHSSSMGPTGFDRIMKHIDNIHKGFGNGELSIQKSEFALLDKLRRIQ